MQLAIIFPLYVLYSYFSLENAENTVSLDAKKNRDDADEAEGNGNVVARKGKKRKRFDVHKFAVNEQASTRRKKKKIRRMSTSNSDGEESDKNNEMASATEGAASVSSLSSKDDSDIEIEEFAIRKCCRRALSSDDSDVEDALPSVAAGGRVVRANLSSENSDDERSDEERINRPNAVMDVSKTQHEKLYSAAFSENSD